MDVLGEAEQREVDREYERQVRASVAESRRVKEGPGGAVPSGSNVRLD